MFVRVGLSYLKLIFCWPKLVQLGSLCFTHFKVMVQVNPSEPFTLISNHIMNITKIHQFELIFIFTPNTPKNNSASTLTPPHTHLPPIINRRVLCVCLAAATLMHGNKRKEKKLRIRKKINKKNSFSSLSPSCQREREKFLMMV
jgi:hypothetical protein